MLNLILFGPPGAGKGTQAEKLIKKYNLIHLSTGDIFRMNIKNQTELGVLAKSFMDKGALVPDEVTIRMLESEVNKNPQATGFIFDGFPRTIAQAEALDKFLTEKKTSISRVLALEVEEEELIGRIIKRGKDSGRTDDQDENVVRNRITEYMNKTAPLKDFYIRQGKCRVIFGHGNIEEIFEKLCAAVDEQ